MLTSCSYKWLLSAAKLRQYLYVDCYIHLFSDCFLPQPIINDDAIRAVPIAHVIRTVPGRAIENTTYKERLQRRVSLERLSQGLRALRSDRVVGYRFVFVTSVVIVGRVLAYIDIARWSWSRASVRTR